MPTDSAGPLLARQRQDHILAQVAQHGGVRVADVVEALGVSEMTVRRDITDLVARGLVDRVHGGAVATAGAAEEPYFRTKIDQHPDQKAAIGTLAAARVRPGDSLALSGGTTTLAVAHAIARLPHLATLTVITNSLPAAQVLHDAGEQARTESRPAPTVILTGGERTRSDALVGLVAVEALQGLQVEWAFLGAHGFDPEIGLMTPNLAEAATNTAMVAGARTPVAVLDASKWGVLGLRTFCPVQDLAVLVTDRDPGEATRAAADRHGILLDVAGEEDR
ncbi:DeoR/GlpR family DNA-binding transcription regulator [Georgenia subflava]|uniref:DeoR family transcriptional regulator n=1 Tax=Georgenia subflava TaxID=1622177 RepID=A0A6N7EF70_9MICO|nr:DeoR/GlpR family DNA-binding transcription regulator [Georgenia subflava]MPV36670.1 DeoR family transcriptional regulator [Georgenia subflava]